MIRPTRRANAAIDPITIPAIAPPDSPLLAAATGAAVAEAVAVAVTVLVVKEMEAVILGNTTPTHLDSALEL
jgi:hypothetical protein